MLLQLAVSEGLKASVINTPDCYLESLVDKVDNVLLANFAQVASPPKTLSVRLITWLSLTLERYFLFLDT